MGNICQKHTTTQMTHSKPSTGSGFDFVSTARKQNVVNRNVNLTVSIPESNMNSHKDSLHWFSRVADNAIQESNGISIDNNIAKMTEKDFTEIDLNGLIVPAKLIDIYDGDTCTIGFKVYGVPLKKKCRLRWINTEEIKQSRKKPEKERFELKAKAYAAKYRLTDLMTDIQVCNEEDCGKAIKNNKKIVYVKFFENDSFDRSISEIYLDKALTKPIHKILIKEGHSKLFTKYEKK
jgi:endonuclease YncB( thermonuclease family)